MSFGDFLEGEATSNKAEKMRTSAVTIVIAHFYSFGYKKDLIKNPKCKCMHGV